MKRALWSLIFIVWAQGAPAQSGGGAVVGQVKTEDGVPAKGLMIAAEAVTDSSPSLVAALGETDGQGRYRLEAIPSGRYRIVAGRADSRVYYPGVRHVTAATMLTIDGGVTVDEVDFVVPQRPSGVKIKGRVARDPHPLMRETVTLYPLSRQTTANTDGTFEFLDVPPGLYEIGALSVFSGSRALRRTVVVGDRNIDGVLLPTVPTINVRGRVTVEQGGPAPYFVLDMRNSAGTFTTEVINPQPNGRFAALLPTGDYNLSARGLPEGYRIDSLRYGSEDALAGTIRIARADQELAIRISPSRGWRRISGHVKGMANARSTTLQVSLTPLSAALNSIVIPEAAVDEDGRFEFPRVVEGAYLARIVSEGSVNAGVVVSGKDIDDLELTIHRQTTIKGRIVIENGAPRPGMTLTFNRVSGGEPLRVTPGLSPAETFTFMAAEGEYRLDPSALEPSISAFLVAGALPFGYSVQSLRYGTADLLKEPLKIDASDPKEMIIALRVRPPLVTVSGRAIGAEAPRFNSGRVYLASTQFNLNMESTIARDGRFEFTKVPPGTYVVRTTAAQEPPSATITVTDRDITDVEARVLTSAQVKGRFIIADGIPLSSFTLPLRRIASPGSVANNVPINRNPDGTFTAQIPEGEFRVELAGPIPQFPFIESAFGGVLSLPASYTFRIMYGDTDVLKEPLRIDRADKKELVITIQPSAPLRRISGHVDGAENLLPRNQGRVTISDTQSGFNLETAISTDGTFAFPKVPPGVYFVRPVGSAGSTTALINVGENDVSSVALRVPRHVTLIGKVVIDETLPIPTWAIGLTPVGADEAVLIPNRGPRSLPGSIESGTRLTPNVRKDGTFLLTVREGEYRVTTEVSGSAFTLRALVYGATNILDGTLKVDGSDLKPLTAVFDVDGPFVKVSGLIAGIENWTPPGKDGKTIRLSGPAINLLAPVNPDGTFEFAKVPPGTYTANSNSGIPGATSATILASNRDVTNVELRIPRQVRIDARIIVEGSATANLYWQFRMASVKGRESPITVTGRTNADGKAALTIPEGEFRLDLSSLPSGYAYQSLTYGAADILTSALKIDAANPLELVGAARFIGPVVKVSGQLEGVDNLKRAGEPSVSLSSPELSLTAPVADDGTFEFPKVRSGTYTLTTVPASAANERIVVGDRDLRGLKLIAMRQAMITPRLVMEGSGPLPYRLTVRLNRLPPSGETRQFSVSLENSSYDVVQGISLPEGEYRVAPEDLSAANLLPPGYVLAGLTYGKTDALNGSFRVDASRAEVLTATIRFNGPLFTASGRVRGADIGRARHVVFSRTEGKLQFSAMISREGTFTHAAPPGVYRLTITEQFAGTTETTITVTDHDVTDINLRLPAIIKIRGRLQGEAEIPPPHVSLHWSFITTSGGIHGVDMTIPTPDRTFSLALPEGEHRIDAYAISRMLPEGYVVESLMYGGTNLMAGSLKLRPDDTAELVIGFRH